MNEVQRRRTNSISFGNKVLNAIRSALAGPPYLHIMFALIFIRVLKKCRFISKVCIESQFNGKCFSASHKTYYHNRWKEVKVSTQSPSPSLMCACACVCSNIQSTHIHTRDVLWYFFFLRLIWLCSFWEAIHTLQNRIYAHWNCKETKLKIYCNKTSHCTS